MEDNCIQTTGDDQELINRQHAFDGGQKVGFVIGIMTTVAALLLVKVVVQLLNTFIVH
ncbi:MAG: hypothetical protein WCP09_01895 [Candidatus Taylorbacteria bacterium]